MTAPHPGGRLQRMLDMQLEMQKMIKPERGGGDPVELGKDPQYVLTHVHAAQAELQELLDETGWKPWATSKHVNKEAAKGEWIDGWHFFMNLALVLEMTEEEIYELYQEKYAINLRRQAENYDGVSSKCPGCRRDFDDVVKTRRAVGWSEEDARVFFTLAGVKYCDDVCHGDAVSP